MKTFIAALGRNLAVCVPAALAASLVCEAGPTNQIPAVAQVCGTRITVADVAVSDEAVLLDWQIRHLGERVAAPTTNELAARQLTLEQAEFVKKARELIAEKVKARLSLKIIGEEIEAKRLASPKSAPELSPSQTEGASSTERAVTEKLNEYIDSQIAAKDPVFSDYKRLTSTPDGLERLGEYAPNYLEVERKLWWLDQYRAADVRFVDRRFAPAWKSFLAAGAEPEMAFRLR